MSVNRKNAKCCSPSLPGQPILGFSGNRVGVRTPLATTIHAFFRPKPALKLLVLSTAALNSTAIAQNFPAQLDLSTIDGSNGFVINGVDADDYSGSSVSSAGDINGDGFDDVIIGVGAPYTNQNASSPTGESYVVFGAARVGSSVVVELATLNGSNGFIVNGINAGDQTGFSVSGAGDFNGDGIDDIVVGARTADTSGGVDAGQSYVVFGGTNVGAGGSLNLSNLNGSNGFSINGADADDRSGVSVSSVGDINGDGADDLIIGAYAADPNNVNRAGESYVLFGGTGTGASGTFNLSSINGANGFVINGIDSSDNSGVSVDAVGDFNDDGVDDVIVGANNADITGDDRVGEVYLIFGGGSIGANGEFNASNLNGSNGFILQGLDSGDSLGFSVSTAGDINDDGAADIFFSARFADPNGTNEAGESYVVFGGAGVGNSGVLELNTLNGSNGFVINGISNGDRSGHSLSNAGDVNGDNIDDVIIGAYRADPNEVDNAGESYVVYGGPNVGAGGSINLSSLNGINGFTINGVDVGGGSGYAVSAAGDVNGDNVDDILVGAFSASPNEKDSAGRTYVVFGESTPLQFCNGLPVTVNIASGEFPTIGNNVIFGTNGADTIVALGGNDTICGLPGDDVINAGPGDDWVQGGLGNDSVFGLAGADIILGGGGADVIVSGDGDDIIRGNLGNDTLNGGPGNDMIFGGEGNDDLFGQNGDDLLFGGNGDDFIVGVGGADLLEGGDGADLLNGGPGDDTVNGDAGNDTVFGLTGDDTLDGGFGNDQVFGQFGADTISGGGGNDELFGNQDDDVITAISGTNTINGGPGDDTLTGGNGDDRIFGDGDLQQAGNDVINGGAGSDLILGFAGADTIIADDGIADTVNGGPGVDSCTTDGVDSVFNCP